MTLLSLLFFFQHEAKLSTSQKSSSLSPFNPNRRASDFRQTFERAKIIGMIWQKTAPQKLLNNNSSSTTTTTITNNNHDNNYKNNITNESNHLDAPSFNSIGLIRVTH